MKPYVWQGEEQDRHVRDYRYIERACKVTDGRSYFSIWKGKGRDPRRVRQDERLGEFINRIADRRMA